MGVADQGWQPGPTQRQTWFAQKVCLGPTRWQACLALALPAEHKSPGRGSAGKRRLAQAQAQPLSSGRTGQGRVSPGSHIAKCL